MYLFLLKLVQPLRFMIHSTLYSKTILCSTLGYINYYLIKSEYFLTDVQQCELLWIKYVSYRILSTCCVAHMLIVILHRLIKLILRIIMLSFCKVDNACINWFYHKFPRVSVIPFNNDAIVHSFQIPIIHLVASSKEV